MFARLRAHEASGHSIQTAVVGAGFVGRALVHQIALTPAMSVALIVSRNTEAGIAAFMGGGFGAAEIVVSDDPETLEAAVASGRPAVTTDPAAITALDELDVVVEATGDVTHGARVALLAIASSKHVISLNFETDATVGPLLKRLADMEGVVYTGSDGDQPGVMMRLVEYVRGIGLDAVAAVNCKGFLDIHATPTSIRPWAEKQKTSLKMTTAFTDGTKMNVENVCVANASGLLPEKRGMHGVETTLEDALSDFASVIDEPGVVDYTLGGDFGSGVFVIGSGAHPDLAAPYLSYLKMGDGPWYLFYRPWHLVQFETPLSIAEAVLDGTPTIAPSGGPIAQMVTMAKRPLEPGTTLDGIGGFDHYGVADTASRAEGTLPVGLAEGTHLVRGIASDAPITLDDVEMGTPNPIHSLWEAQQAVFSKDAHVDARKLLELWQ